MLLDFAGREIRRVRGFGFTPRADEWVIVEPAPDAPEPDDAIASDEIDPPEDEEGLIICRT